MHPRPQSAIPVPLRASSFSSPEPPFLLVTWSAILKRVVPGSRTGLPFKIADDYSRQIYLSHDYTEGKSVKTGCYRFFFTCLLPLATNSSSVPVSGILTWVPWSGFWYKDGQQLIGFLKRYSHISGKSIFSDVV